MKIIFALQGRTADGVDFKFAAFEPKKEGAPSVPARLTIGTNPSMPCTVFFNDTSKGVLAEIRGFIPKLDEQKNPILKIENAQELYDFETYSVDGKERWVETSLGTLGVRQAQSSGNNYVMAKFYHQELAFPIARLLYDIRNIPTRKDEAIEKLNAIQNNHDNSFLVNMFPQSSLAAKKVSEVFKAEIPFNEKPQTTSRKRESSSPSPSGM
ncbi:hypothetical protein ACI2KR_09210 [Pseudomonas luteola]